MGVETDERGFVETDDSFETTADGVYAIGDASGPPMFTHSAHDDADLLYRHLAKDETISTADRVMPWAVFTDPQIGHVGMAEAEARDAGYDVGIGQQDFAEQGKPKPSEKPRRSHQARHGRRNGRATGWSRGR